MKVKLFKKKAHILYKLADGTIVPGGSTISKIGEDQSFLIRWAHGRGLAGEDYKKVTDEAADIGSVAHHLITCYFKGDEGDFGDFGSNVVKIADMVFAKFMETWADQELEFVANEVPLVSEKHRYGGTLDLVGRDKKGRLVLVDEKSSPSIYGSFYRQVTSYRELWNENNDEKIAKCFIFRHGKKNAVDDTEVRPMPDNLDKHFNVFLRQLDLYYAFKALNYD